MPLCRKSASNRDDSGIHIEISQTADKNARRVIVETPVDAEFCSSRKALQAQLGVFMHQDGMSGLARTGRDVPRSQPSYSGKKKP